ncbi:hypothetical protein BC829DRAFT_438816 [Chytridium lagenaria]|nr:hypothetical protein BC829DRAFT_438816 [Chytridium lagenaria]
MVGRSSGIAVSKIRVFRARVAALDSLSLSSWAGAFDFWFPALLSLSPAVASLVHLFLSRNLRHAPIEDRGVGEGIQVQGLDLTADLLREPKKFDPCECFPQPVAYALVISFKMRKRLLSSVVALLVTGGLLFVARQKNISLFGASPSSFSSSSSSAAFQFNHQQHHTKIVPASPNLSSNRSLSLIPASSSTSARTAKERMEYIRKYQFFKADGFQYCKTLKNATFDALATLSFSGSTLAELNPTISSFTSLSIELARFACYCAADGANPLANLTESRLIQWVDPIAILLMVHGDESMLENVKFLIEEMDDGAAIILIHVDLNSEDLYKSISALLQEREAKMNEINNPHSAPVPGNVFLATKRFRGAWGYISLVWIEISGFYEKSREIHRVLSLPQYINKDFMFIEDSADIGEMSKRLTRPHLPNRPNNDGIYVHSPKEIGLMYPPFPNWRVCKQHQWMILSRDTVNYFRTSHSAALALAYIEHSWIPDEVMVNNQTLLNRVVNDNKRYLRFLPNEFHPKTLDINCTSDLGDGRTEAEKEDPQYLFARKVDVRTREGKELVEWIRKNHIERNLLRGRNAYGELGGEQWVARALDPLGFLQN